MKFLTPLLFRLNRAEDKRLGGTGNVFLQDGLGFTFNVERADMAPPRLLMFGRVVQPNLGVAAIDVTPPHVADVLRSAADQPVDPDHVRNCGLKVGQCGVDDGLGDHFNALSLPDTESAGLYGPHGLEGMKYTGLHQFLGDSPLENGLDTAELLVGVASAPV